jgi:prepilin-type processing-associated H-X9-DG protein
MKVPTRSAFSIFELLIVLAILVFLLSLLGPVIVQVRLAAARAQSQNNLKQLALACHNYHDTFKRLPSGNDKNNFSATAHLLPFIEQQTMFQRINFNQPSTDMANAQMRKIRVQVVMSPLDSMSSAPGSGATNNYLFNAGSKHALEGNNGVFYQDSRIQLLQIRDGTSNTLMIGETLIGAGTPPKDVQRQHVLLRREALQGLNQDSGVKDFKSGQKVANDRGATWIDGRFLQGTFTATRRLNDSAPDVSCAGAGGLSGLRGEHNGTNIAMCDGSVRWVTPNVSLNTWRILAGRDDGEVLPEDW